MATTRLRWGRILLGGLLGELILIAAVIPIYATGGSQTAVTALGVGGSFVAFVPVAWWLGRGLARPILHGALMGAVGAAIYMTAGVVGQLFVEDAPAVPLIYYLGHALKLAGGSVGGWLAGRSSGVETAHVRSAKFEVGSK